MTDTPRNELLSLGVAGLDDILLGGIAPGRMYLVEGNPGAGKTTLSLQFLLEGAKRGDRCLFVSLSETEEELQAAARSHGWSLEGCVIAEAIATQENLRPDARYTMFHPSEVELGETIGRVIAEAQRIRPQRVVVDSLSELRLLAAEPLRYRRQVLALKQFFSGLGSSVIFTDDRTNERGDMHLHSICHGVFSLERRTPEYGVMRRRLQITKMRGRQFREGYHDFRIMRGGLEVFPRLVAADHHVNYARESVRSGLDRLDHLLGGGLARGTSTLIVGPAGAGKSTLTTQYAIWAAGHGETAAIFLFDESLETFRERSAGLGMEVDPLEQTGRLRLRQVDVAELSPGEFAHAVRRVVDEDGARLVVIDTLNGYLNAMASDRLLTLHLHELLAYLGQLGVTTLLVLAQHGFAEGEMQVPVDASYLADTVVLLRYFESAGRVRQAISVMKKRTGRHERTIRELSIDKGLQIGEPLESFQGVLTGNPVFIGDGKRGVDERPR